MELYTSHGAIISTAMLLVSDSILGKLYTYTPDGIRSSKTVNGTKTEYLLNGTQILAQKTGSDVMWFFYDSTGTRIGVQQGNVTAYYMYNLQGDVVGLADAATGKIIAKYLYDAWGKCVSVENADGYTIGTANPFRYRGYYYDNETGFYYLNSRYYNPEVGRFLNADAFVTTDITGALSANMFAYCENNPVNMVDPNGCDPIPSWAKRIVNGNATEADYKKALSVNPEGWGGHARNYVDLAISIAREEYPIIMAAEHHKRGTTNKSNEEKHQNGQARKQRDNGGEKGDARRKPNPNKRKSNYFINDLDIGERIFYGTVAVGATIGVIYLVANDVTIIGVLDDAEVAPLLPIIWDNAAKAIS